jgi:uncharacterized protein YciI
MLYVIKCVDKPDHLQVRLDNRPAHVDYLKSYGDKLFAAGPTLSEDDDSMNGSVVILDLDSRAEAEDFCENDPYAKAGLFQSVVISKWKKVLPAD